MNFFVVKQLPVLPPETYLEDAVLDLKYVELVVPRVLELTYTAHDLKGFAADLGYQGPPFPWDDDRRHHLQSELDAIYSHMYGLERSEVEWILDAPPPSSSFPALKHNEIDNSASTERNATYSKHTTNWHAASFESRKWIRGHS